MLCYPLGKVAYVGSIGCVLTYLLFMAFPLKFLDHLDHSSLVPCVLDMVIVGDHAPNR